jgi:cytochrome c oxidase assembly factor CtaG
VPNGPVALPECHSAGQNAVLGKNGRVRSARRATSSARSATLVARLPALVVGAALALAAAVPALAHGGTVPEVPPDLANLFLAWKGDPLIWLPTLVAAVLWWMGVRKVNRAHPEHPVPRVRSLSWALGLFAILLALDSGIEHYDTTLFWDHMVQHMLLTLVAPPLLLWAGPITLLLRASSAATRNRWIYPFLHARVIRFLAHPVVAWILFAAVMWGSHFSPLFDAALENEWMHRLEHGLFLGSALLFWWPVVGPDPSPWRLRPAAKVLYVGLQMPQNTFLSLAIFMSSVPLYQHYVTTARTWGPTPLEDQQIAGAIMWLVGDMMFITAVVLLVLAWMRDDERRTIGEDRRLAAEETAIRERAARLAARRAAEAASEEGSVSSA